MIRPVTMECKFNVDGADVEVSALIDTPPQARCVLVLGHGAGAGMRHQFMQALTEALGANGVAVFRYQFPYMEQGRRAPDRAKLLTGTVGAAVRSAADRSPDLPLFVGGKSMGGRMASLAAAQELLPGAQGLVFFGFPLHQAGKPASVRGEHLTDVRLPMLFLQGTRDKLADLALLQPLCETLGTAATLQVIEGADHSFQMLKRSGISNAEILARIASLATEWMTGRLR